MTDTFTDQPQAPPANGHRQPFDPRAQADMLRAQGQDEMAAIVGSAAPDDAEPPGGALLGAQVLGYAYAPGTDRRLSHGRYEGENSEFLRWLRGERPRAQLKTTTRRGVEVLVMEFPAGPASVLGLRDGDTVELDYVGDTVVVRRAG